MNWQSAAAVIGVLTGFASLIGIFYGLIFKLGWLKGWKESVDEWQKKHDEAEKDCSPHETALMCKTMWDIYVVGALRDRPDLATHRSPLKLTPYSESIIPDDLKITLNMIRTGRQDKENIATGWLVVKYLGITKIEKLSKDKELSIPETIAVLSTYIDELSNNHHSGRS